MTIPIQDQNRDFAIGGSAQSVRIDTVNSLARSINRETGVLNVGLVNSPLYVICTVFNPRRFQSRIRLYNDFKKWIEDSGVKLLTVEIAFGERTHAVTAQDDPWHLQLFTRHELWHKERALNLGLQRLQQLAPDCRYVIWSDTDVRLARTDWVTEALHLLQHYAVIQMFSEARCLGPNHANTFTCRSIAKTFDEYGLEGWAGNPGVTNKTPANPYMRQGHPGLMWGFRLDELYGIGGWLDTCINGSGDLHMAACYAGDWKLVTSPKSSPGYRAAMAKYGALCGRHIRRNMHFMEGAIDHYWHGRSHERGYQERWKMIDKYQIDPFQDLVHDMQGLWKLRLDDPRVMAFAVEARKSLAARNEDVNEL